MMVVLHRARARSTHLGIGDDVLRNVGRALAQTHARTHGEFGFGFGIERAIDRMNASRCVESSRSDACAGMGWDALDSCVRARTHESSASHPIPAHASDRLDSTHLDAFIRSIARSIPNPNPNSPWVRA